MNKTGALLLTGAITLAIGAGVILGNAWVASQAMAAGIDAEDPPGINAQGGGFSETGGFDGAEGEITPPDRAKPAAGSEEPIPVAGSSPVVLATSVENGGTIMVNGKEVLLKDYIEGQQPGDDDISKEAAIEAAVKEITQEYALRQEVLERFTITAKFYTIYEDISTPVWWVNLYPTKVEEFSEIGCYTAILDGASGEAIRLLSAADGKG